jgi:hypothetical protein
MQRVLDRIATGTADYARGPFFAFLGDDTVEPRRKLAFAPYSAHFVMTFADLSTFIFQQEAAGDPYQELVNATAREDEGHWRWYLADLEVLGVDWQLRYSEAIGILWGDRARRLRALSYHLCRFALAGDSLSRLVLLWCMEQSFRVSVGAILPHARAVAAQTGRALAFFGPEHSDAESAHPIHEADARRALLDVTLDDRRAAELCAMVDEVFALLAGFADDLLDLSTTAPLALTPGGVTRRPARASSERARGRRGDRGR